MGLVLLLLDSSFLTFVVVLNDHFKAHLQRQRLVNCPSESTFNNNSIYFPWLLGKYKSDSFCCSFPLGHKSIVTLAYGFAKKALPLHIRKVY